MRRTHHDTSRSRGLTGLLFSPPSGWVADAALPPDLRGSRSIGIDLESRDPELNSRGPGFIRGDAEVVGVSVSDGTRGFYLPFGHLGGGNLDRVTVVEYLQGLLRNYSGFLVGTNLQYELLGLRSLGITVSPDAKLIDVSISEALIDEERNDGYDLGAMCQRHLGSGKEEEGLREAASAHGVDPKSGLWKLHAKYVGPYAEWDALAPLKILEKQLPILKSENLLSIFELESKLIRILHEMTWRGIRMDLAAASSLSEELREKENSERINLRKESGLEVDVWSGPMLARMCDTLKIHYPRTPRGNPSFEGEWLEEHDHPILKRVAEIRTLNRLRSTFIDDWIFKNQVNGKIHPQWKQMKRDDGGTRTGRMAASNPNPQQVPSRSDVAPRIRSLFIPEEGKQWCKLDYSQQEPRILVHYAVLCKLTGAELIAMAYRQDRDMDIYKFLAEAARVSRRDAKDITLGRCYGMGIRKMASKLNISEDEARKKLDAFDQYVPFVREAADMANNLAQRRGYIRTIWGRRRHFNYWESANRDEAGVYVSHGDAISRWGRGIKRAHTHKALNSLIQGSAADMTKSAMLLIYEKTGLIPYMQVHDELNYGVTDEDEAKRLQGLAETCVEMQVPIKVDMSIGDHWR